MIERVTSGIPGLDKLISGGFVKGSTVLITGGTGTGKTTFCAQFLWHGLQKNEHGVFVTLEEDVDDIKTDMLQFGWDFEKFEKKRMFRMIYQNPFEISDISSSIIDAIDSINAKRVVIDPISLLGMYVKDPAAMRKRMFQIVRLMKKSGCTSLITSEIAEGSKGLSRFGVMEFIVDGVILITYFNIGSESFGNLEIRKMRRTDHMHGTFPLYMSKNGLKVGKESITPIK
jgi:KaiC/GvpD/RAD55 family RecA-like ATPase